MFDRIGIELFRSATPCVRAKPRRKFFLLMTSSMRRVSQMKAAESERKAL
jgi:hypothetical protein